MENGISLAKIDTSLITDMSFLFELTSWDNERFSGIESWNVSNVESMSDMFAYCENFRQDLSNWNVSAKALLNCEEIFYQCPTNMLEVWNKKQRDSVSQGADNAKYLPKSYAELKALCKQEDVKLVILIQALLLICRVYLLEKLSEKILVGLNYRILQMSWI
ncbi:DUF285 domain-containing protein [Helicobacter trogontum]|nr:DUF285 domain-containing protein [Helicobacter trogontum]